MLRTQYLKRGDTVTNRKTGESFIIHNVQPAKDAAVAVRSVIICSYNEHMWNAASKSAPVKEPSAIGSCFVVEIAGHRYKTLVTEKID